MPWGKALVFPEIVRPALQYEIYNSSPRILFYRDISVNVRFKRHCYSFKLKFNFHTFILALYFKFFRHFKEEFNLKKELKYKSELNSVFTPLFSPVFGYKREGFLAGHWTSLFFIASETASVLLETPSLFKILLTWNLTVERLNTSFWAIFLLERPSTRQARIFFSWLVS